MDGVSPKTRLWEQRLIPVSILAVLLFVLLGNGRSIWLDEANSIAIASEDFQVAVDRLRMENNLPAYYMVLHVWIMAFGDSEAASRLLSGLFYVSTIVVVFLASRFPEGRTRHGLYSAFFYLISSQAIHQAQNVRMYSMLGFVAALSMYFFLRLTLRPKPTVSDGIALALVNAIGSFTHMWFFFLIGAEALAAVLLLQRRLAVRVLLSTGASLAPFALLWLPALNDQLQNGATDWMPPFRWVAILDTFIRYYGGAEFNLLGSSVFYGCCILVLNRMGRKAFREWTSNLRTRLLTVCLFASIVSALIVCIVKPIYWPDRYTIIALPALAMILGEAMATYAPRLPLLGFCYALLALQIGMKIYLRDETESPSGHSDRRTAEFIVENAQRGDVIAFTSLSRLTIDYYLQRLGCGKCYQETSYPLEIDAHPSWRYLTYDAATREKHVAEAKRLIQEWLGTGAESVWLVYGGDIAISHPLKDEIEKHYKLDEEIPLRGPYHLAILRYRVANFRN